MISSERTQAEFDHKAARYETGRLSRWYRAQGQLVSEIARPRAGSTVLDVGCGTGWLLRRLVASHPGVTGLGIDLSPRMIEVARERARVEAVDGLTFVAGDWMQLDPSLLLQANGLRSAELVCCVSAVRYLSDPGEAMAKMHSVTTSGGRLLLLDRTHARSYRSSDLVGLAAAAGYDDVQVLRKLRKLFWRGKLATRLTLVSARRS